MNTHTILFFYRSSIFTRHSRLSLHNPNSISLNKSRKYKHIFTDKEYAFRKNALNIVFLRIWYYYSKEGILSHRPHKMLSTSAAPSTAHLFTPLVMVTLSHNSSQRSWPPKPHTVVHCLRKHKTFLYTLSIQIKKSTSFPIPAKK